MEHTPTFTDRTTALRNVAEQLRAFAETVMLEVQRMEAAQSRFQQRVGKRSGRHSSGER